MSDEQPDEADRINLLYRLGAAIWSLLQFTPQQIRLAADTPGLSPAYRRQIMALAAFREAAVEPMLPEGIITR